jgi:beta-galactosidase
MWETFHYGVCYYPEAWDRSLRADDIQRIRKAGFNVVRMGEGAWSYWEPREGQYQFELFDEVIDLCRKADIKVIMGTPTYAAPAWVSHQYPEVLRRDFNRVPLKHGGRRNLNYTSPKYIDLSDKLCTALAQHYKHEKQIIGWQLDNEFNCHSDVSYAESDTIAFRAWCKDKYKTLDRLNKAWGTSFWSQTYTDWQQIDLPHPTAAYNNPHRLLDETRFISDCVVRFAARQAAILRKASRHWWITHNGLFPNVKGTDLAELLDFWSHDQYPAFWKEGDWTGPGHKLIEARSLSFPFAVMEQQSGPGGQMAYLLRTARPGQMRLWAWQSIVHGASSLLYFRWRTCPYGAEQEWHGILDADNRDNRRLTEAADIGKEIRKLPKDFYTTPPAKVVGVLRDYDNEANDRRVNTYTKDGIWEPYRWCNELSKLHIPVDELWPTSEFRGYKVIVAPHLRMMTRELAAKLTAFVKAGGTLVLGAQTAMMDENLHTVPHPAPGMLRSLAGVEVADWTTVPEGESFTATLDDGAAVAMDTFVERLQLKGAKALAHWSGDDTLLAQSPAITQRKVDRGQVFYVGGYLREAAIRTLASLLKVKPIAQASESVEIIERRAGKRRYIALLNYGKDADVVTDLPAGTEMLTGKPIKDGMIALKQYGVALINTRA